MRKVWSETQV